MKAKSFLVAVLFQVAVLLILVVAQAVPIIRGTTIELAIKPVDPTSPLRGDYLVFQYDINRIDKNYFRYSPIKDGDAVYVDLFKSGKYWQVRAVYNTPPKVDTYIIGHVTSSWSPEIKVTYGIEQYFIPEGKGSDRPLFNGNASALVSISPEGKSSIRGLLVNSQPWP